MKMVIKSIRFTTPIPFGKRDGVRSWNSEHDGDAHWAATLAATAVEFRRKNADGDVDVIMVPRQLCIVTATEAASAPSKSLLSNIESKEE